MSEWIKVLERKYGALTVTEIKCPYCKHKETYHDIKPRACYICERRLR